MASRLESWSRRRGGKTGARRPLLLAAAVGLAAITIAPPCAADDAEELELAKNRFDAGRYDEAHQRFASLLDASLPPCDRAPAGASGACRLADPDLIERARAFDAASLIAQGHEPEADAQIEKILRQNTGYAPNPALFPPRVVDRFTVVRGRIRKELEALDQQRDKDRRAKILAAEKAREAEEKWIAELSRLAGDERVVEQNSRWLAMLPLGVGQFQNGDIGLGVLFAVSEAVLGTASLVAAGLVNSYASTDTTQRGPNNEVVSIPDLNQQIRVAATVNRIAFAAWGGATALGIIQAQIAFQRERTVTRKRPIPARPKATVVTSVLPGGFVLGVAGTF